MIKNKQIFLISNQKGLLSVDFLIGIVISFVIMLFLLKVSFSLVVTEVAQYIAFSVARAHSVGDKTLDDQRASGKTKFNELIANKVWKNFFTDTFEIGKKGKFNDAMIKSGPQTQNGGGDFKNYLSPNSKDGSDFKGIPFTGVVFTLKLDWLKMNIPFLGSTAAEDKKFETNVTGFLFREPSQQECQKFMDLDRYKRIIEIDSERFNFSSIQQNINAYVAMEDNGC